MTAKTIVPVSLIGGLAGNQEYYLKTKLETADNVYYQHPGGVRKRFGTSQLATGTAYPIGDNVQATSPQAMFGFNVENVRVDFNKLYGYSQTANARVLRDNVPEATSTYVGLTSSESSSVYPDVVTYGGFTLVCFQTETDTNSNGALKSNQGELFASILDSSSGATLFDRVKLATGVCTSKAVQCGHWLVIVFTDFSGGNLHYAAFDTTNPTAGMGAVTALNLSYGGSAVQPSTLTFTYGSYTEQRSFYDACADPFSGANTFLLAFQPAAKFNLGSVTAPLVAYRIILNTATTYTPTNIFYTSTSFTNINNVAITEGANNVWVTFDYNSTGSVYSPSCCVFARGSYAFNATTNSLSSTLTAGSTTSIGIVEMSPTVLAWIATDLAGNSYVNNLTYVGTTFGQTYTQHLTTYGQNLRLVSRPWLQNGYVYAAMLAGPLPSANYPDGSYLMVVDTFANGQPGSYVPSYGSGSSIPVANVRPVVNILPRQVAYYGGNATVSPGRTLSSVVSSGSTVQFVSFSGLTNASSSIGQVQLHTVSYASPRTTALGNSVRLISGGVPSTYDGKSVAECGFLAQPGFSSVTPNYTGGGLLPAGTYSYKLVYEWVDAVGNIISSDSSVQQTVTLTGPGYVNVSINPLSLTFRQDAAAPTNVIKLTLYRTTSGGTVFYRLLSLPTTVALDNLISYQANVNWSDDCLDSVVVLNEQLYEDGGTLSNVSPPSASLVCTHNNRFWLAGTPDDTIWYSKTFVLRAGIGFNDAMQIPPFQGGRVTSICSLDDYLMVFKQRSIYIVQGDGPDVTGANSTLQNPIRISAEVGCVEPRSVVVVGGTCFFMGERGIYSIDRGSYQVTFIGEDVQNFTQQTGSTITSAVHVPSEGQVRFTWVPTTASAGKTLVFDIRTKSWTTYTYSTGISTTDSGACAAMVNGVYCWAATAGSDWAESTSTWLDGGYVWVPVTIETGWVALGTIQGYQRVQRVQLLAQKMTDVNISCNKLFDYDPSKIDVVQNPVKDTYSRTTGTAPVQFEWGVVRQKSEAIKLQFVDSAPVSPASVGTGQGLVIDNVILYASVMRGKKPNVPNNSR